jgi:hypothetical protein
VPATPIVNVGWLNQNALRAYPLSQSATRRDTSNSYTLSDDLIVDMVLPVNAALNYNPASFYISQVNVFGVGITIEVSYWTGVAASIVGSIAVDTENANVSDKVYYLQGEGDFEGVLGKVVIGTADTALQRPGAYTFDLAGARIESSIIVPDLRGVSGFRVIEDETDEGVLYQGDIALEAGSNFRIGVSDYLGKTVLTLSAIDGEGTIADCACEGEMAELEPIRTINGVLPDSLGNINLLGDDCLEVTPQAGDNAVQLTDKCSKPCCGCPELDVLVDDQKRTRDQVQTLENLTRKLESNLDVMQTLMSMIGPCG